MPVAARPDIEAWYDEGVDNGSTFMIIMCDTFDHEDYPVYISKDQNIRTEWQKRATGANMQTVMEVYNLSKPFDKQKTINGRAYDFGEF